MENTECSSSTLAMTSASYGTAATEPDSVRCTSTSRPWDGCSPPVATGTESGAEVPSLPADSSASAPLFGAWKHVGRRREGEELWKVFCSGTGEGSSMCECVLVKGEAGAGKTSLVSTETLEKWAERHGGHFCSGKFDHLCRPEPHAAVVGAMDMLVGSVLRRGEAEIARVQRSIAGALGRDVATLVDVVPSTRALVAGSSPFASEEGPSASEKVGTGVEDPSSSSLAEAVLVGGGGLSQHHGGSSESLANRFKYVVRSFLRAASSPEHPLVLLLDDVQWADEASLDLLLALLNDKKARGCVVAATLRTNNGSIGDISGAVDCETCTERTARVLSQLNGDRVNLTVLELQNLRRAEIESLLAAHLLTGDGDRDRSDDRIQPEQSAAASRIQALASLLLECTRGNPLLLRENLVHLRDIGLFTYDADSGLWEWDTEEIRVELATTYREIVKKKVMSLPPTAAELLKTASCLSGALDEEVLARVLPSNSTVASDVESLATRGFIYWDPSASSSTAMQGRYSFAHDELKMSLYQLIPIEDRKSVHSLIGRNLWTNLESGEADRYMFEVIGQFMLGDGLYTSLRERKEIALLFLRAGQRAMAMSSFESAYIFLNRGIECLGDSRWQESYTLALNLCNAAAEVAYCIGQFSTVECLVEEVLQNARIVQDTYRAQSTRIYALGGGNRMLEAISAGVDVLRTLGVTFPANPTRLYIWAQLKSLERTLKRKYSLESIMRLRVMVDPRALAAAQILNLIFLYATSVKLELAPLIGFKLVHLTLKYGLCPVSCMGFVTLAMSLCGFGGDIDAGYAYGQLSLRMFEKFQGQTWLVRLTAGYYGCVHPWKKPIRETLLPLKRAHEAGLESGDIEFSMMCVSLYVWSQFDFGPLPKLEREIQEAVELMDLHGQLTMRHMIAGVWQAILNLMGRASGDPCVLAGEAMDETHLDSWKDSAPAIYMWANYYLMALCYLFGRYDEASVCAARCQEFIRHSFGAVDVCSAVLFETLTNLALERKSRKRGRMKMIKQRMRKMKYWARHSPHNFLGMHFLLEAELAAFKGDKDAALSNYVCAVSLSKEVGALQRVALSNERAGKYLLGLGQRADARQYLDDALRYYEEYGAVVKVDHLRREIRDARLSGSADSLFVPC